MTDFSDETRWRCKQCGEYVPEDQHQTRALSTSTEPSTVRYHIRYESRGAGWPMIGSHMVTVKCGPLEQVTVSVQEQFLEWSERQGVRK